MKGMTLEAMAKACHGTLIGAYLKQYLDAEGVVIDSREVRPGYVFLAIRGERVDGHQFIDQVFEAGALAVVSEQRLEGAKGPYILVESTLQALKDLAAYYRSMLEIPVVGITGSVGKTSTKEMIASVLSEKFHVHKTKGNFNNEIGLPLTILKIRERHQVAVLEMGISDFKEMHRLAEIAKPNISVITNIGLCHLENLKTRDGILQAKTEMFDHLQEHAAVILNGDDDKLCTVAQVQGREPVFYGIEEEKPEGAAYSRKRFYASNIQNQGLRGIEAELHLDGESRNVRIPIPGRHNVYNALAAAAVGEALGLTTEEICQGIAQAHTIDGRTNIIEVNGMTVIDDCYNANPVSMKAALDVLATAQGRTVAVLGDMGELGANERALHYSVGEHLARKKIQVLYSVGELSKEIARAARSNYPECEIHEYDTKESLLLDLLPNLHENDAVLVKASHFMNFPEIVEAIIST